MKVLAIDPGTEKSAYVIWNQQDKKIVDMGIRENKSLLENIYEYNMVYAPFTFIPAIEMVSSYGMPVGKTTFKTILWIGRFFEAFSGAFDDNDIALVYRKQKWEYQGKQYDGVTQYLCHSSKAKDSNIRQALIDKFGDPGTKKNPGILYGVKKDIWSALAIAVTFAEQVFK